GLMTDVLDPLGRDRTAWNLARKEIRGRLVSSPIPAEQFKQLRRKYDKTILVPLALAHGDQLPVTVDIGDKKVGRLRDAQACSVDRREKGVISEIGRGLKQREHLFLTEHEWQFFNAFGIRYEVDHPLPPQRLLVKEA